MSTARLLPYGDRAALFEVDDPREVLPLRDGFLHSDAKGICSVVPAARTVLVEFDPAMTSPEQLSAIATTIDTAADSVDASPHVDIPVRYDGADLDAVAEETGLSTDEVVALHSGATYRVQFCGFSPGFAYLTGLDARLHMSRLASPRPSVPAGSVAIAGEYTGVYPRSSPGGWRLLGRTSATLFDLDRDPPALLVPGVTVRFVPS